MRNVFSLSFTLMTALALVSARPALADTEITTCGQELTGGKAFLSADLDCAGSGAYYGVHFDGSGVVDLRGFTIRNVNIAIACGGNCNVTNGAFVDTLTAVSGSRVKLTNVAVSHTPSGGTNHAVVCEKGALLKNVTIDGAFEPVVGDKGTIKLDTVTITNGRNGVRTDEGSILALDTTITGVSRAGLYGTRVKLIRSSVTGSGTDPDCNTLQGFTFFICGDVVAWKKPLARGGTCDTSIVLSSNMSLPDPADWNLCSQD